MDVWDDVRRRARTLEADIDHKLIAFNRLSVSQVPAVLCSLCALRHVYLLFFPVTSVPSLRGRGVQSGGRADEEKDALLQSGGHVESLAAELDSCLVQVSAAIVPPTPCIRCCLRRPAWPDGHCHGVSCCRQHQYGCTTACSCAHAPAAAPVLFVPSDPCCSLRDSSRRRMRAWGDACATWAAAATARGSCTCCSDIGKCCMNMRRSAVKSRPISKSNVNGCMHPYEYQPRIPLAFAAVCCSHCFAPVLSLSSSTIAVRVSAGHEYLATNKTHTANTQMVLLQG